jgi:hypothetical protein
MPPMPETHRIPGDAAPTLDSQCIHDLRNAVNAAGFCVHAAERLLLAGNVGKAIDSLARASRSLERIRDLLSPPPADAAAQGERVARHGNGNASAHE